MSRDNGYLCKKQITIMMSICKTLAAAALVVLACSPVKAQTNMENVLNERQQCMVAISCLEAKGDLKALAGAINSGLDAGLTVSQVKEALSQLSAMNFSENHSS